MADTVGLVIGITIAIVFGIPIVMCILALLRCFVVVHKGTAAIVERFGKFHALLEPGLHILMPFADRLRVVKWRWAETYITERGQQEVHVKQIDTTRIDLRETVLDFPFQAIITRDNVEINVHPMLLYKLIDPVRVAYETYDLAQCVEKLVQTTLRSIVGDMGLDDTLASREEINRTLMQKISSVCLNWGFQITRVDVLEIVPTATIQAAMHKQLAAERIRRAAIVTAEGFRQQAKTEAEGAMQSMITLAKGEQQVNVLRAKGRGDSKIRIAAAEAQAISITREAVAEYGVDPSQYLIALRYIDTFMGIAQRASSRRILFPFSVELFPFDLRTAARK